MSSSHSDPEYLRNARTRRAQVNAALKAGRLVTCQRCGREIQPGQRYDIGHRIDASRGGDHSIENLGPEHRGENRRAGGKVGALMTNTKRGVSRESRRLPTWLQQSSHDRNRPLKQAEGLPETLF